MRPSRPVSNRTAASSARTAGAEPSYPTTRYRFGGVASVFTVVKTSPAAGAWTGRGHTQGCIQRGKDIAVSNEVISGEPGSTGSGSPGAEDLRLRETRTGTPWRAWGPYLSERQWGTVREDYSDGGDAWSYFSHEQSRSRAYRWGGGGTAGTGDDKQRLCLALALWNEQDPILKERLFGLTNAEGNHGEDVKEYYFYVDNLPTHSYQRWLYKYPQAEFPYNDLVAVNRARSRDEFEYELIDTGIFDEDRYFDVEVEHAKAGPEDIVCRITVHNRSARAATLHVLPTLWFRNTWSWGGDDTKPTITRGDSAHPLARAERGALGGFYPHAAADADLLFCENETNAARIWGAPAGTRFPKDGIGDHLLSGAATVNPDGEGTKAAAHVALQVPGGGQASVLVRLTREGPEALAAPGRGGRVLRGHHAANGER